jgi:hypothetical protein
MQTAIGRQALQLPEDLEDVLIRMSSEDRKILIGFINTQLSSMFGMGRPLNAIIGFADILAQRPLPPAWVGRETELAADLAGIARYLIDWCNQIRDEFGKFYPKEKPLV